VQSIAPSFSLSEYGKQSRLEFNAQWNQVAQEEAKEAKGGENGERAATSGSVKIEAVVAAGLSLLGTIRSANEAAADLLLLLV